MRFVPNVISALRIALTPVVILCLLQDATWARLAAFLLFLIGAGSDYADGVVARLMQAQTRLGRFLDPLADKVLVLGTFGALAWLYPSLVPWWAVVLIALRDVTVTGLRMRAEASGRSIRTWKLAKSKTALAVRLLDRDAPAAPIGGGNWSDWYLECGGASRSLVVLGLDDRGSGNPANGNGLYHQDGVHRPTIDP